jgi:hypothetical protein
VHSPLRKLNGFKLVLYVDTNMLSTSENTKLTRSTPTRETRLTAEPSPRRLVFQRDPGKLPSKSLALRNLLLLPPPSMLLSSTTKSPNEASFLNEAYLFYFLSSFESSSSG